MTRRALLLPALVVLALAIPSLANAATNIPGGQTVRDVKAIGADVHVDGTVAGRVIVVDGNLVIGTTGTVRDATVIGGSMTVEPGGRVRGDVFQLGATFPEPAGWRLVLVLLGILAMRLVGAWLLVGGARWIAASGRVGGLSRATRDRQLRTLAVGALAGVGVFAASILLAITVLGLILAVALWGALLAAISVGIALSAGEGLTELDVRRTAIVALTIPVFGDALAALAAIAGLGAFVRFAGDQRSTPMVDTPLTTQ